MIGDKPLLPTAVRDRMSGEIVCYGRTVVHQEWPQMQHGKGGDTINPWAVSIVLLQALGAALLFVPTSNGYFQVQAAKA